MKHIHPQKTIYTYLRDRAYNYLSTKGESLYIALCGSMESEDKGLVCVTGGTGYVASWLIMRLLQQGYTLRTTVRSHPGQRDVSFLTSLPGATEKLHFFHADLIEPDSFRAAIEGCTGVFHVAHPVGNINELPEDELTKMTVEGTLGILKVCAESKTVKRVVYTSSAATVVYNGERPGVVDENTWTDIDFYRSLKTCSEAYVATKTKRKSRLGFCRETRIGCGDGNSNVGGGPIYLSQSLCLGSLGPSLGLRSLKEIKGYKIFSTLSSKKLRDCGFKFEYGVEEMYGDAIRCCKEKGYL